MSRRIPWIVLAFICGMVVAFRVYQFLQRTPVRKWEAARFTEARMQVVEHWSPCSEVPAENRHLPLIECRSKAHSGSGVEESDTVPTRGATGLAEIRSIVGILASGNLGKIDLLIQRIIDKNLEFPQNSEILNELAVAYSVRANLSDRPYDLALALDKSLESLEIDPDNLPSMYNVALFSTRLQLDHAAIGAWRQYLDRDRESEWSEEGRAHLRNLTSTGHAEFDKIQERARAGQATGLEISQAAREDRQEAREWVTEVLLPEWGRNWLAGNSNAALKNLSIATIVAGAISADGDQTAVLATDYIRQAVAKNDPVLIGQLAAGHSDFGEGRSLDRKNYAHLALPKLKRSQESLKKADSPFEPWSSLILASAQLGEIPYEETDSQLLRVIAPADPLFTPALFGFANWLRGLIQIRQGNYPRAIEFYETAQNSFQFAREKENLGGIYELLSEAYRYLGLRRSQWEYAYAAVRALRDTPTSRRLHNVLWNMAESAAQDRSFQLSRLLHDEDVETARAIGDPAIHIEALFRKATSQAMMGETAEATTVLERAQLLTRAIGDEQLKERTQARIVFAMDRINVARSPEAALRGLTNAVNTYQIRRRPLEVVAALISRAECNMALGDLANAERDLDEVLKIFEMQTASIRQVQMGLSFLDLNTKLYDLKVELALGRRSSALDLVELIEKAKAGSAIEAWRAVEPREVVEHLDPSHLILEYFLTSSELVRIGIRRGSIEIHRVPLSRFKSTYEEFEKSLAVGLPSGIAAASSALFDILIPLHMMVDADLVVVVPDKALNEVPFSALLNRWSGKYLVEMAAITEVPSIRMLIPQVHSSPQGVSEKVLIVDGTDWNRQRFPDLAALPEARVEQSEIASIYGRSNILRGEELTVKNFLLQASRHKIVHFSGHAIASRVQGGDSYLVLGKQPGQELLQLNDLPAGIFSGTEVIVLAACGTVAGTANRSGGLQSIGGSLIAAGARVVVGTIRDVEDSAARAFSVRFHENYSHGMSAAEAARQAQVSMLQSGDRNLDGLTSWSSYQVVGWQ